MARKDLKELFMNIKEKIKKLKKKTSALPSLCGVYIMRNKKGREIYIGKARSLKSRVRSHFTGWAKGLKTQALILQTESLDYILTENEVEAFLLEASLVKKHRPRWNIRLKDDKAYPYLRIKISEEFPRFYFERRAGDPKSLYFGPYTAGGKARALLDFLNQNFHLRDCSNRDFKTRQRPCLSYETGACPAPCVKKISVGRYQNNIQKALRFLKEGGGDLLNKMDRRMKSLSRNLRFEEAGALRDQIKALQLMEQSQVVWQKSRLDRDTAVAQCGEEGILIEMLHFRRGRLTGNRFYFFKEAETEEEFLLSFFNRYYAENLIPDELLLKMPLKASGRRLLERVLSRAKGTKCHVPIRLCAQDRPLIEMAEKNARHHFQDETRRTHKTEEILKEIAKRLSLPGPPRRMECYDISHLSGSEVTGSRVVFEEGKALKGDYRAYHLRPESGGDDYLCLKESLKRSLINRKAPAPDMILIDGGRGQLSAGQRVLKELNLKIPLVAIAKDRVCKGALKTKIRSSGERFFLPGRKNPLRFPSTSKALALLLHLRDEAHRTALKSHRKKQERDFLKSRLDSVKGLGPKGKAALLKKFGGLEQIKTKNTEELAKTPLISKALAGRIKERLSAKTAVTGDPGAPSAKTAVQTQQGKKSKQPQTTITQI